MNGREGQNPKEEMHLKNIDANYLGHFCRFAFGVVGTVVGVRSRGDRWRFIPRDTLGGVAIDVSLFSLSLGADSNSESDSDDDDDEDGDEDSDDSEESDESDELLDDDELDETDDERSLHTGGGSSVISSSSSCC